MVCKIAVQYGAHRICCRCIVYPGAPKMALKSTMMTGVLKMPYKIIFAPFFLMLGRNHDPVGPWNIKKAVQEYRVEKEQCMK